MYDKILLPTDGSEASKAAVDHAGELAEKFDATVHLLYVADVSATPGELRAQAYLEHMKEFGEETVESIEEQLGDNEVEKTVTGGLPHQEINNYIHDEDIDLVTMGSHGRSGLDRLLLGSVTEKVLRTTSVPVLTVRKEEE